MHMYAIRQLGSVCKIDGENVKLGWGTELLLRHVAKKSDNYLAWLVCGSKVLCETDLTEDAAV